MGAYGSPDTGNLYSGNNNNLQKKKKIFKLWLIPVIVFSIIALFTDNKLAFIVASIGLVSIGTVIISFVKLIIDLIRNKKVNKDVIVLFTSIIVFAICIILSTKI